MVSMRFLLFTGSASKKAPSHQFMGSLLSPVNCPSPHLAFSMPSAASPEQVHAGAGGQTLHPAARAFTVTLTMAHPLGDAVALGQRGTGSQGLAFSHGFGCTSIFCSPGLGCCLIPCCVTPREPGKPVKVLICSAPSWELMAPGSLAGSVCFP